MPKQGQPIQDLVALLQNSAAKPVIVPSRLAPSAIYDVEYRTAVIALVFEKFAKPFGPAGHRRVSSARLKLLQFITLRPWLLSAIQLWSKGVEQEALAFAHSIRIRRGFLSDTAHDDVINYLVACGIFFWQESHLVNGQNGKALHEITDSIEKQDLFASERKVIAELVDVKITNAMLEGW
jgi:hypothetical protein